MTNTVIDNFSTPERLDSDIWVAIYGKNNRFDQNSLLNKGNRGVTLAVDPFTVYDDIFGISFKGNVLKEEADVPIKNGLRRSA